MNLQKYKNELVNIGVGLAGIGYAVVLVVCSR